MSNYNASDPSKTPTEAWVVKAVIGPSARFQIDRGACLESNHQSAAGRWTTSESCFDSWLDSLDPNPLTTCIHVHTHRQRGKRMATLEVTDLPVPAKDTRFPSTNQALNCWYVTSWMNPNQHAGETRLHTLPLGASKPCLSARCAARGRK